jgi:hypothetical protein
MNIGIFKSKEKAFRSGQLVHVILRKSSYICEPGGMIEFVFLADGRGWLGETREGTLYRTQDIEIKNRKVYINGLCLSQQQLNILSFNSGYNSQKEFLDDWPQLGYEGKIIHWTNFKY